jgi:membrane-associated phospholipid phosphatase
MAVGVIWVAAFHSGALHTLDGNVFAALRGLQDGPVEPFAAAAAGLVDPRPFALAGALLIGLACAQGRARTGVIAAVVLIGANVTTQGLKSVAASPRVHPRLGDQQLITESWPSGHATAAMSLVLVAIMVAPPSWRRMVAVLGALYAAWAGTSVMILGWHYPSDVAAAFLVATTWAAVGVAAFAAGRSWHSGAGTAAARHVGLALAVAAAVAIVASPGFAYKIASALDRPGVALGAAAIGLGGLAAAAAAARTRRRRRATRAVARLEDLR